MADKVFTFLAITFVVSFMLHITGIVDGNTSVNFLINSVQGDFKLSEFWQLIIGDNIFYVLGGLAAVGATVFGNSSAAITAASVVMAKFLADFINDMVGVLAAINTECGSAGMIDTGLCGVVYWIALVILSILAVLFAYSLFQFVRGDD